MKLRIIDDIVDAVGRIHRLCKIVARHDPGLAKQMKESSSSIGLNAGEGLWARGGNRTARLDSAMSSGRELIISLRICGAAEYLSASLSVGPYSATVPSGQPVRRPSSRWSR